MIFLRHIKYPSNEQSSPPEMDPMGDIITRLPAILPRSGMGFYLIDLFQLKLICWGDRCLILDHDQTDNYTGATSSFNRANTVSSAVLVSGLTWVYPAGNMSV